MIATGRDHLQKAATEIGVVTPDRIMELGHAFRASKALLSAVELGIFTTLSDGPLDIESIRERVGLHERSARDFLDALVALSMLVRHEEGCYANTLETDLSLARHKPTYVGGLLESYNVRHYDVWASLTNGLRAGEPQCTKSIVSNFSTLYADK